MADVEREWVRELEVRFGVTAEFAQRMLPLLRTLAAHCPSDAEWTASLAAVAAAYWAAAPASTAGAALDESLRIFSQFNIELRKMDESLKVLAACLSRVRSQLRRPGPGDRVH
jgi:hypothetical protein